MKTRLHQLHLLGLTQGGLQDAARQVKAGAGDSWEGGVELIRRSPFPKRRLSQGCNREAPRLQGSLAMRETQTSADIRGGPA